MIFLNTWYQLLTLLKPKAYTLITDNFAILLREPLGIYLLCVYMNIHVYDITLEQGHIRYSDDDTPYFSQKDILTSFYIQ